MRPSDNPPRGTPESCFYGRKGHLFWAFLEAYTVRGVLKRDFSTYRTSEPHCTHPVISIDRSNRKTHEKLPFPLPPSGLIICGPSLRSEIGLEAPGGRASLDENYVLEG